MVLKYTVETLDGIPEAVQSLYADNGNGAFVLQVEGVAPKARVDEFRTSNIALKAQLEEINARYSGIDPDAFHKMSAQAAKIAEKKLIEAGKVDELIASRVEALKAEHDKERGGLSKERDLFKSQLEGLLVDGGLRDAALKAGVRATAIDDVLLRGRQATRLVDGAARIFDGDKMLYGSDAEPMTLSAWVASLSEKAPHLFEPSTGAGTPKGGSQGQGGVKTITRAAWDALEPASKMQAAKTMKIVD